MKKTYSAPVITSTKVADETLGSGSPSMSSELPFTSLVAAGFGL